MSRIGIIVALAFLASCMSGCVFDTASTRATRTSTGADITSLRNDLKRLETEVELLKDKIDRFTQQQAEDLADMKSVLRRMEGDVTSAKADIAKDVDAKLTALENRRIKVTNSLNAKLDGVLKQVTSMLRKMGSSDAPTGVVSGGTEKGFYHTVASGDSPWSIAQKYKDKYGVTTQDILEANGLEAGDPIRPGQKLFIPVKE